MSDELEFLKRQLVETEAKLRLIQERKAKYILSTDIPLQLVSEERETEDRITEIKAHIARLTSQEERLSTSSTFTLEFTDRDEERAVIRRNLQQHFCVHIIGAKGLGKTYLLKEISREMSEQNKKMVWIDFALADAWEYRHSQVKFMAEFARQTLGNHFVDDPRYTEEQIKRHIAPLLANLEQDVILFLDNVDVCSSSMLHWIRCDFIEEFGEMWSPINPVLAITSGQHPIPEWSDNQAAPRFREQVLHHVDQYAISTMINDAVAKFGPHRVKELRQQTDTWKKRLAEMTSGVWFVTRGHPRAIERVLKFAYEDNGWLDPAFFDKMKADICKNILKPIIDEEFFASIDDRFRVPFRDLCLYRYIWPGLSSSIENFAAMWMYLSKKQLISHKTTRSLHAISSVIRQMVSLVLFVEDESSYYERNLQIGQEYEQRLYSTVEPAKQRASYLIEALYHRTQESAPGEENPALVAQKIEGITYDFIQSITSEFDRLDTYPRLHDWLREDIELREAVTRCAGTECYDRLIQFIENCINKESDDE